MTGAKRYAKRKENVTNSTIKADYDVASAQLYDDYVDGAPHMLYIAKYSIQQAIGDVEGKRCIDAACGNGSYMLDLYRRGASFVAGVDLSNDNLEISRKKLEEAGFESEEYESFTQADLSVPQAYPGGPFDMMLMNLCVCYSETEEQLHGWMENAKMNLAENGRLICLNTRGALPTGVRQECIEHTGLDYLEITEDMMVDGEYPSYPPAFVRYSNGWETSYFYHSPETVVSAMEAAGFSRVSRLELECDPAYTGEADLSKIAEVVPYDFFIAR